MSLFVEISSNLKLTGLSLIFSQVFRTHVSLFFFVRRKVMPSLLFILTSFYVHPFILIAMQLAVKNTLL